MYGRNWFKAVCLRLPPPHFCHQPHNHAILHLCLKYHMWQANCPQMCQDTKWHPSHHLATYEVTSFSSSGHIQSSWMISYCNCSTQYTNVLCSRNGKSYKQAAPTNNMFLPSTPMKAYGNLNNSMKMAVVIQLPVIWVVHHVLFHVDSMIIHDRSD